MHETCSSKINFNYICFLYFEINFKCDHIKILYILEFIKILHFKKIDLKVVLEFGKIDTKVF